MLEIISNMSERTKLYYGNVFLNFYVVWSIPLYFTYKLQFYCKFT